MMTTRRSAGLVALTIIAAGALIFAGCGGGDGGAQPAQTGSVSGTIKYAPSGDVLGGIEVSIGNISTTTDANGDFTLNRVPTGQRTLVIEAAPDRDLTVPPGVPLTVNVQGGQTAQLPDILMVDDVDVPPAPPS